MPLKKITPKIADNKKTVQSKKHDYLFAAGKRKTAVARVRLYPKKSEGKFIVNDKNYQEYFPYFEFQKIVVSPLEHLGLSGKYNITIKVAGGGVRGQAESIRHGLARVLLQLDEKYHKPLRAAGYLTRDARKKERKKPGLKRARRAPQFSKR